MITPDGEADVHCAIRDVDAALDRLAQLGGPDQIAEHLTKAGAHGEPGCPFTCVIANYLVETVAAVCGATVTVTDGVMFGIEGRSGAFCADDIPPAVVTFIGHFDRGAYPALVHRPAPLP